MEAHSHGVAEPLVPGGRDWERITVWLSAAIYLRPHILILGLQHLIRRAEELPVVDHHTKVVL